MEKTFSYQDRYFGHDESLVRLARDLHTLVADLPLICPHGHISPEVFSKPEYSFGTPVDLFIIPDHYVFRMLYSQGIPLEQLGIPRQDSSPVEEDHRRIWQLFADHFHLFRGTPTGIWIRDELQVVFSIREKLNSSSAQRIYDQISAQLNEPAFRPRALYERFNIDVLTTTDEATSRLLHHQAIRNSGWSGRVLPTFRPDLLIDIHHPKWRTEIAALSDVCDLSVTDYLAYIRALEDRRSFFKQMGATATDHGVSSIATQHLTDHEADQIFQRALTGTMNPGDAERFMAHMLVVMAQMSIEDGLVMQVHPGSFRNHNPFIYQRFGRDMGADIPVAMDYTRALKPLLDRCGNESRLTLILFTLDETTYSRELAPLAGHYPALKLGPPWWFFDSLNGMERYFEAVLETAGIYNTVGFNDDTRAFMSIPVRHDLWRRAVAKWLARLVLTQVIDRQDAEEMIYEMAYGLAKRAYKLGWD